MLLDDRLQKLPEKQTIDDITATGIGLGQIRRSDSHHLVLDIEEHGMGRSTVMK
jgi:hypothetical protein